MLNSSDAVPLRQFGRYDMKIEAIGFGGRHLGNAPDQSTAVRLVRQGAGTGLEGTIRETCRLKAFDGRMERFNTTKKYDSDLGREMRGFQSSTELPREGDHL
jgi:hypothetical protein